MPTNNPISQNNDDYFYTAVCAYVRGEPMALCRALVGEEQAEMLVQDNPAILDDKDRLLAEVATIPNGAPGEMRRIRHAVGDFTEFTDRDF
jgi:hypothetical protein